jgi:hypothetical protein
MAEGISKTYFTSAELVGVIGRAEDGLQRFRLFRNQEMNSAEFSAEIPIGQFKVPEGLKMTSLDLIIGAIRPEDAIMETVSNILAARQGKLETLQSFEVRCVFRRVGSDCDDSCGVLFWQDKLFVTYHCGANRRDVNKESVRDFIVRGGAPILMREEGTAYYLAHSENGMLRNVVSEMNDANPKMIWCEVPAVDRDRALSIIRSAVSEVQVKAVEWTIIPEDEAGLDLEQVLAMQFPCERFSINFTYKVKDLKAVAALTDVQISEGFFETELCTFELNGKKGILAVRTSPKGHKLYADWEGRSLEELGQVLAVEFEDD